MSFDGTPEGPPSDPTISTEGSAPTGDPAPAVSGAEDNSADQKVEDAPDKPDETTIAQVEVVDKPEDHHV